MKSRVLHFQNVTEQLSNKTKNKASNNDSKLSSLCWKSAYKYLKCLLWSIIFIFRTELNIKKIP